MTLTLEQVLDFLAPDETLEDLFSRLGREKLSTGIRAIDKHVALRPGVFLEACGGAGCGKSELLMQVWGDLTVMTFAGCYFGNPKNIGCRQISLTAGGLALPLGEREVLTELSIQSPINNLAFHTGCCPCPSGGHSTAAR